MYNYSIKETEILCKHYYCQNPPVKYLYHTATFEPHIHRTIEKGHFRTNNPENADLYYLPVYLALFNFHKKYADLDHIILPYLRKQSYFDRYNNVDHILTQMLISHNEIPITLQHQFTLATQTTIGDINWEYSKQNPREAWRYTTLPYQSSFDKISNNSREIQAFLIGQMDIKSIDPRAKKIRKGTVKQMKQIPNSVVIHTRRNSRKNPAEFFDIFEMMSHSEFCPVPHGDGPTSKRLFDTFRTGCIPIVLSDEVRLPFEGSFVDYSKAIIQIPHYNPSLLRFAMGSVDEVSKRKIRKALYEIDSIFDLDMNYDTKPGDQVWAWAWHQFFRQATVSSVKRRRLLKNYYL